MSSSLSVLFCGSFRGISTSRMRAEALERLGVQVARLDSYGLIPRSRVARGVFRLLGYVAQQQAMAGKLAAAIRTVPPDIVWCEKTIFLSSATLRLIRRQCNALIIHYNPDDPFGTAPGVWKTFVKAIPEYDVHLVPRPANGPEYRERGARHVIPFDRGFCPLAHRPQSRNHPRWSEFATTVAFTGSHEAERSASLAFLANHGIPPAIRGSLWQTSRDWKTLAPYFRGGGVDGEAYGLALGAPQITLHFLRHANRDEQDSRTFEIPACGGFMMAEWSPRHAELFEEDVEAVFFRSDAELLEKVRHYLARPEECAAIAARGRARAIRSGYDYESRMRELLGKACQAAGRDDLLARLPPPRPSGAVMVTSPPQCEAQPS
jgi:spore maturation protein CgeB